MSDRTGARLTVMAVHRLPVRGLAMISGTLDGGSVRIGDRAVATTGDGTLVDTTVCTVELHSPPGMTTFAMDESLAAVLSIGDVLSFS